MVCWIDRNKKKTYRKYFVYSESNNLLEDLHIPDSRLIDGDAAELALIGKCLINLIDYDIYIMIHFK